MDIIYQHSIYFLKWVRSLNLLEAVRNLPNQLDNTPMPDLEEATEESQTLGPGPLTVSAVLSQCGNQALLNTGRRRQGLLQSPSRRSSSTTSVQLGSL